MNESLWPLTFHGDVEGWSICSKLFWRGFSDHSSHVFQKHRNRLKLPLSECLCDGCEAQSLNLVQQIFSCCTLFLAKKNHRLCIVVMRSSDRRVEPRSKPFGNLSTRTTVQDVRISGINPLVDPYLFAFTTSPPFRFIIGNRGFFNFLAASIGHG
jgi:hypothetical protein